jgi:hypothetical protein
VITPGLVARRGLALLASAATAAALASPGLADSSPPLGGDQSPSYTGGGIVPGQGALIRRAPRVRLKLLGSLTKRSLVRNGRVRVRVTVDEPVLAKAALTARPAHKQARSLLFVLRGGGSTVVTFLVPSATRKQLARRRTIALTAQVKALNGYGRLAQATLRKRLR